MLADLTSHSMLVKLSKMHSHKWSQTFGLHYMLITEMMMYLDH